MRPPSGKSPRPIQAAKTPRMRPNPPTPLPHTVETLLAPLVSNMPGQKGGNQCDTGMRTEEKQRTQNPVPKFDCQAFKLEDCLLANAQPMHIIINETLSRHCMLCIAYALMLSNIHKLVNAHLMPMQLAFCMPNLYAGVCA